MVDEVEVFVASWTRETFGPRLFMVDIRHDDDCAKLKKEPGACDCEPVIDVNDDAGIPLAKLALMIVGDKISVQGTLTQAGVAVRDAYKREGEL